jgi:hypothetical protein
LLRSRQRREPGHERDSVDDAKDDRPDS